MLIPPKPFDEEQRLAELRSLGILDTEQESLFDDLVKLGSFITGCPISVISLIDSDRQWFKARHGVDATQTHRDISFCAHAILQDKTFVVENAAEDERFSGNPLVIEEPNIRFYAGHPLVSKNGFRLGTFCAIDRVPKKLTHEGQILLEALARQATFLIEQRQNERELERTRKNSQILFEESPLIIVSLTGPNHVIEYINQKDSEFFGGVDSIGKSLIEIQPEAEQAELLAVFDDVLKSGKTQTIRDRAFNLRGKERHFDFVLTPRFGLDGQIDGVMGIIDDITHRKKMEMAIQQLHEKAEQRHKKLAELFERVPIHIALFDGKDHQIQFANRLYRDLFLENGYLEGKALAELVGDIRQTTFSGILDQVFRTGQSQVGKEHRFERRYKNGKVKEFYFNYVYEATKNSQGEVSGILAAIVDVTEQVKSRAEISSKVDALRDERELRERFVATLSHDLQNPLTAAKVAAERLKRKEQSLGVVHKMCDRIIFNINRTETMARNLLDANRLKAGEGLPISPEPCCINEVVQEAINGIASVSGRNFHLEEKSGPLQGYWDAESIRRIVENLAGNAIKYGEPDTPISLKLQRDGESVELAVHNLGPAIPEHERATLFNPHKRAAAAVNSPQQGWGMGLALVKGIAQAHKGAVRVHSEEGSGTTFVVRLPLDTHGSLQKSDPKRVGKNSN